MKHFGRDYREITDSDIESAIAGLLMDERSTEWLVDEIEAHEKIDTFASAVLCAAALKVIKEREIN